MESAIESLRKHVEARIRMGPYWGARLRTVASNGCRDVRRRVKRRSITERTPIAACRATVPLRHSRRGLRCERGGTVPDGCGASGTEKGSG